VHTLHGAIAMVDIPLLTQLLSPLEGLFKRLRASSEPLSPLGVRLLGQAADVVDQVMSQFDAPASQLPNVDALTAQITEMRDDYPESRVAHVVFEPQIDELEPVQPATPRAAINNPERTILLNMDLNGSSVVLGGGWPSRPDAGVIDTRVVNLEISLPQVAALRLFQPKAKAFLWRKPAPVRHSRGRRIRDCGPWRDISRA